MIKDLNIIHGIPYVMTFATMKNNVLDASYFMLIGHPWLHNVKDTHDWGNNLVTVDGNGIMHTIVMNTNLDSNMKWLKVLFGYNFVIVVIDEEEDFFKKPN